MDAAHLHLLTNHIPILLTFLATAMLIWGFFSKNSEHYKIAFIGYIIAAIAMIVVLQSGENAEDIVENIAGIAHESIELHEEAANITRWFSLLLGIGGIAGLIMQKQKIRGFRTFIWILLMVGVIATALLVYTGNLGGQIRHTEITDHSTTTVIPADTVDSDSEDVSDAFGKRGYVTN